jgi:hypothetical protein
MILFSPCCSRPILWPSQIMVITTIKINNNWKHILPLEINVTPHSNPTGSCGTTILGCRPMEIGRSKMVPPKTKCFWHRARPLTRTRYHPASHANSAYPRRSSLPHPHCVAALPSADPHCAALPMLSPPPPSCAERTFPFPVSAFAEGDAVAGSQAWHTPGVGAPRLGMRMPSWAQSRTAMRARRWRRASGSARGGSGIGSCR